MMSFLNSYYEGGECRPLFSKQMAMRIIIVFLIFFYIQTLPGQEMSINLPFLEGRSDATIQIVEYDGYYYLPTISFCFEDTWDNCHGLMKVDRQGNVIWKLILDSTPYKNMNPNGQNMAIRNDTIYMTGQIWKDDHDELRLMALSIYDGELFYYKDSYIPYISNLFLTGGKILNDEYVLFGELRNVIGHRIFICRYDLHFNELNCHYYGQPDKRSSGVSLIESEDGGYVLVYGEAIYSSSNRPREAVIELLDKDYMSLKYKKLLYGNDFFPTIDIATTSDSGFILTWQKYLDGKIDTFPFPAALYKLDKKLEVEWEYIFASRQEKFVFSTTQLEDNSILGIGTDEYWYLFDLEPESQGMDGWCFNITMNGQLKWERSIRDGRDTYGGRLWHGIQDKQGFIFVGDLWIKNPTGIPFLDDPNVWMVTLDSNGCWNGHCGRYIYIIGDSIAVKMAEPTLEVPHLEIFPNPAVEEIFVHLPNENSAPVHRMIQLVDINGRILMDTELKAPKSIIRVSQYPTGVYFLTHFIDGHPVETRKIILQR